MRLNRRFFETAGITGDLEVQARGAALVPVLAQRGLSNEMLLAASLAATAEAALRFPGGMWEKLACAPNPASYRPCWQNICASRSPMAASGAIGGVPTPHPTIPIHSRDRTAGKRFSECAPASRCRQITPSSAARHAMQLAGLASRCRQITPSSARR
jgi:hypothetical protein